MGDILYLLLPVVFPITSGALIWAVKPGRRAVRCLSFLAFGTEILFVALAGMAAFGKTAGIWQLCQGLEIRLRLDGLGLLMAVLVPSVWLLAAVFSFEYMLHEEEEYRLFGCFLMSSGALIGVACAANFVTLYTFFELMTLASVPLVFHSRKKQAIRAGMVYLAYSMFGASLALGSFFFLSHYTSDMNFALGGVLEAEKAAGHENFLHVLAFLSIAGFGAKAGLMPLHPWLPTAHPVAPAPGSAVLSGLITKAGIVAVIRMAYYIFGVEFLAGSWVQTVLLSMALITVFMGSMLAYKEKKLKKRLAYSSVSQLSYALFGIFLLSPEGLYGALLQVVFHALTKNTLFLCAGAVIYKTGKKWVYDLRGIGKEMPVVMWCFTLAAVSLVGIPPAGGFLAKWHLAVGALEGSYGVISYLGPAVLLISALLTAGYLFPIFIEGFFPGNDYDYGSLKSAEPTLLMKVPLIVMSSALFLIGMFGTPLFTALRETAASMIV
ncbi:proton-conducting transporter membrane subunit [Clostridium sp. AM58-1XD]|uniref:complex I subunit 5 family protein n=1 Tax=Clostridium sp. AM58-1XD TaxID=2292307 RepID=UPI000E4CE0FB|nr:proton-conducting transporter membrane subunit [Clostridium sp. AM58-1XD]RGZ00641.1 sodium:proton antiporter [Clostridium sp. AM58-1XD]